MTLVLLAASTFLVFFALEKPAARFLAIDTIQHLSVARSLLEGQGLVTSILYYEVQYALGAVPAAQTVWPPGAAFSAAMLSLTGVDLRVAFVIASGVAVVAGAALLFLCLRATGVRSAIAGPAAAIWAVSPSTWHFALRGETEAGFVMFCCLAFLCVIRAAESPARHRLCVAAATAAALALLWRYQGVYLLPALFAAALVLSWHRPAAEKLATIFGLLALPSAVFAALMWRNISLTGALSGTHSTEVDPLTVFNAVKFAAWFMERSLADLLGLPVSIGSRLILVVALAAAVLTALSTIWHALKLARGWRRHSEADGQVELLAVVVVGGYAVVGLTHMFIGAITTASWYLAGVRYMTVLLPALLFLVALGAERLARRRSRPFQDNGGIGSPLLAVIAWLGVAAVLASSIQRTASLKPTTADIEVALAATDGAGMRLDRFLAANDAQIRPMLASWAHELHLIDGKPVVGLQPSSTSPRQWDFDAVLRLSDQLGVRSILVIDSHMAPPRDRYTANQVALRALAEGAQHPRLTLVFQAPGVRLFEITRETTAR